jgi:putative hydrolase of the HAD superfamily
MKAVIFDLGKVLVNYDGEDTFLGISELTAVSSETMFTHYQTIDHAFGTGQLSGPGYYELVCQTFGLQVSYHAFATTFCRNQQRNEQALAFASYLQAQDNIVVGIISNTNEIHAGWLRANLPELDQFSSVILSNEVGLLKPDPAIYKLALSHLNVLPDQALFVDDVVKNVAGGTAVGLAGYVHTDWNLTAIAIENWLQREPF